MVYRILYMMFIYHHSKLLIFPLMLMIFPLKLPSIIIYRGFPIAIASKWLIQQRSRRCATLRHWGRSQEFRFWHLATKGKGGQANPAKKKYIIYII
jgi:hypothetical protein